MKLYRSLDDLPADLRGGAVAIGNFDGVHQGHAQIMRQLLRCAQEIGANNIGGGKAIAFTFDPHPVRLLRPQVAPAPLTWTDRKAELLGQLGVDVVLAYPTDEALLALSPLEFFDSIICRRLAAKAMVEGPNFYFGHDRTGDIQLLRTFCQREGIQLEIVPPVTLVNKEGLGEIVSSSRVRKAVEAGDVQAASRMLTQPYRIRGIVTHGAGRGGKIGFPTANMEGIDTLLPAAGVYAGRAWVEEACWAAAVNIGPNPTFGEHGLKVEAHLIEYDGSLYGKTFEVELLKRLRDIRPFSGVEELQQQIHLDVSAARQAASCAGEPQDP